MGCGHVLARYNKDEQSVQEMVLKAQLRARDVSSVEQFSAAFDLFPFYFLKVFLMDINYYRYRYLVTLFATSPFP